MANLASKKGNHVSGVVQGVASLLTTWSALTVLAREAGPDVLNYVDPKLGLLDGDFVGANAHLTAAQYQKIIAAITALDAQLKAVTGGVSIYCVLCQAKP